MRVAEWERYRALVECSADVIVLMDGHGIVQYVNATAATRFGQSPSALVGTNAFDLVHPDDRRRAVESLHRALGAAPDDNGVELGQIMATAARERSIAVQHHEQIRPRRRRGPALARDVDIGAGRRADHVGKLSPPGQRCGARFGVDCWPQSITDTAIDSR